MSGDSASKAKPANSKGDAPSPSSPGVSERLRAIAFDEIYLLPGVQERGESQIDGEAELEKLTPQDREKVLRVASRRLAFQVLFEMDARGLTDISFIRETLLRVEGLGPIAMEKIATMIEGAYLNRSAADAAFRELAPEWPTHRLAGVDRAILRLGYYEIFNKLHPAPITLNEAVELAKHFSTEKSPSFVNALLDKVARAVAVKPAVPPTDTQDGEAQGGA